MTRFGPAGNSVIFYEQGYKSSDQAPKWLHEQGLSAFEYSLGRGITVGEEKCKAIAQQAEMYDIAMSVHAPYFVNLAAADDERKQKTQEWLLGSLRTAAWMGGDRAVFHPGGTKGIARDVSIKTAVESLRVVIKMADDLGLMQHCTLCPETMGKVNQLGNLDEVIALCNVDERLIPCIDFGHMHTLYQGLFKAPEDFVPVLEKLESGLGKTRAHSMQVHFSHIEYGKSGEIRHLTFEDQKFGPYFDMLAAVAKPMGFTPRFICESAGVQSSDALTMKRMWEAL